MAWFKKQKKRVTTPAAAGEEACEKCGAAAVPGYPWCEVCAATFTCSFCGARRVEVQYLVSGPAVYICERCIRACQAAIDSETGDRRERCVTGLLAELASCGPDDASDVAALLEAAVRLAEGRGAPAARIAGAAFGAGRPDLALRALEAVPESERDFAWMHRLCAAHYQRGDYAAAAAAIDGLDLSSVEPADRIRPRLTRIACRLEADPAPAPSELDDLLGELEGLAEDNELATEDDREVWRRFADECRAACLLGLEKPGAALSALDAVGDAALSLSGRIARGDCLARLGRSAQAHAEWTAVKELAGEGTRPHHEAAERLARSSGPFR